MKNWSEKGRMIRSKEKEKQAGRKTATKQILQLASRTSRYKNQLAPRYSTSPTIMGTIIKNYIIIILFEKIIMKKECHNEKREHYH
jgi:hypothetical protein